MPPAAQTYDHASFDPSELSENLPSTSALKRAVQAMIVGGLGAILIVSILTYSPFDPTGDTAILGESFSNFLGTPGASLANWMLQFLGWAALPFGFLMIFAAARAVLKPRFNIRRRDTLRRSGLLISTVFFLCVFLAAFPVPQSWPMGTGIGGWVGDSVFQGIKGLFTSLKINPRVGGGVTAFLIFLALGYSFGRFIGMVGRDVAELLDAAGLVWAIARVKIDSMIAYLRQRFQKSYIDPMEQAGYEDTHVWAETPGAEQTAQTAPYVEPYIEPAPIPASTSASMPAPSSAPTPTQTPSTTTPLPTQEEVQYTHAEAKPAAKATRKTVKAAKYKFPNNGKFVLPKLDLLSVPPPRMAVTDAGALKKSAEELSVVLSDFGVEGEIAAVRPGPVVTLYEFVPAAGVKSSRVINLADDIARSMAAQSARVAVVPGRNAIGIELPNRRRETVYLRDMLASKQFKECGHALPLAMGEDIGGKPFFADLAKMPHMLVAGTTGSGKSVGINAMILSLMYTLTPEQCKFIMIDPKMLELSVYDDAPHLLAPVVTNPKKAVVALKWAVREMESRYKKMSKMKVRSIAGYNEKLRVAQASGESMSRTVMTGYDKATGEPMYETEELQFEFMPFIVIIIDEMADLMMVAGKDIEGTVQRLAQMARAAGIHLIMATQRPSVDVITGTIKANFPTRISFSVSSKIDSRTILGEQGGEQLLGMGDMLYLAGGGKPRRLHGPFVDDDEVEKIANFIKAQGSPSYLDDITTDDEEGEEGGEGGNTSTGDETFDKAVAIVANDRKASTSYIQRRLGIGYNRAATLIERMEADGMIGPAGPGGKREIFLPEKEGY